MNNMKKIVSNWIVELEKKKFLNVYDCRKVRWFRPDEIEL